MQSHNFEREARSTTHAKIETLKTYSNQINQEYAADT